MKVVRNSFSIILIIVQSAFSQSIGYLFAFGGGDRPDSVMQMFVQLAGGADSKIVVVPNASAEPFESAKNIIEQFQRIGCSNLHYIISGSETENIILSGAKGIFFTGGDQNRLTKSLSGTKIFHQIKEVYESGGVVGGTSAGAAVLSKVMITGNEFVNKDSLNAFSLIRSGNIETAEGFGFIDNVIIDQHFIKRKRHNRLLTLVLENPHLLGIGIDESTACIFYPDHIMKVMGSSSVILYDATETQYISMDKNNNFTAKDIKLTVLKSGDIYNLQTQELVNTK